MERTARHQDETPRVNPAELLGQTAWVRSLARVLARDAAAADDLAQETLAAALLGRAPSGEELRPWLAGTARNLARLARRERRHRGAREKEVALSDRAEDHARILAEAEAHRAVVEHVMALDERDRELLFARYFQDRSPTEIARREGRTVAAVSSQLTRAHARLRARLEAAGGRERWLTGLAPLLGPAAIIATPPRAAAAFLASSWTLGAIAAVAMLLALVLFSGGSTPSTTLPDAALASVEGDTKPAVVRDAIVQGLPDEGERTTGLDKSSTRAGTLDATVIAASGSAILDGRLWLEGPDGDPLVDSPLNGDGSVSFLGLPSQTTLRAYLSVDGQRWDAPIGEVFLQPGEPGMATWMIHLTTNVELRAVDQSGRPFSGQVVGLMRTGTRRSEFASNVRRRDVVQARRTGDDGVAAFEGVAPGRYGAGVIDYTVSSIGTRADGTQVRVIEADPENPGCPVTIPLEVPHNVARMLVDVPVHCSERIGGRVIDPSGEGLADISLRARSDGAGGALLAVTDDTGHFSFGNVIPGLYSIGSDFEWHGQVLPERVEVASGTEDLVLEMVEGGRVELTITGPDTDDVWIWQARVGPNSSPPEGCGPYKVRDGRLQLTLKSLQPGTHWITAHDQAGTRLGVAWPVHVDLSSEPQSCTLLLSRALEVELINHDPERAVRALPALGDVTPPGGYAPAGESTVFAVPPGRSEVKLRLDGGAWERRTVEGAAGDRVRIEVGDRPERTPRQQR